MKTKKNGTRAMTTAKNKVFIRLLLENCYRMGSNTGRIFPGGGHEQILDWWVVSPK